MLVEEPPSAWRRVTLAGTAGFGVGAAILAGAWVSTLRAQSLPFAWASVQEVQAQTPALWILALLPSVCGLVAIALAQRPEPTAAPTPPPPRDPADDLAKQLVSNLLDGVIIVDPQGRVLALNPSARVLFGYEAGEAAGLPIDDLIPDHAAADADRSVIRTTSRDQPLGVEWHVEGCHKDGSRFPLELTWFEGQGAAAGRFVYLVRDPQGLAGRMRRTNNLLRESLDRAEAESRNKDRFVARVAYDLRTPLASLLGYVDVLTEDAEDLGAKLALPDLERIRAAGQHIQAVITNTLELVASDAEHDLPSFAPVPVLPLIDELARAMRRRARRHDNLLHVEVQPDVTHVHADAILLRRILFKLIDNACRHTERGQIRIEASRVNTASGPKVRFYIADTGPGLREHQATTVFDEGDRSAHAVDESGRRLTLPLARRLARRMNGELSARSVPGEGTVFLLELTEGDPKEPDLAPPL